MKFTFAPESRPLDGYTIKRAIHRGGFGEVYYALSEAGKEVALKLLNNNLEVELRGVSQCLNLKHPNLVTIFDIREDADKDHGIVMEYVGGRGLYEVMQDYPQGMPLKDVLFWLNGISGGLAFLHDRGIVHRDLKPANVFCDSGIVKIGDVGLSKYISESRRSAQTQSVGTVYYMAPEVARGRYGREVDVYAIGIMLVEMLTGHVPFEGQTTAEVLMKHLTAEPDLSALPAQLQPVLSACLEKDPARRIADIEELERRFLAAVRETGLSIDQPTPVAVRPASAAPAAGREQPAAPGTNPVSAAAGMEQIATNHAAARARIPMATFKPANGKAAAGRRTPPRAVRPAEGAWQSMSQFWSDKVPTPAKWIICGAVLLLIIQTRAHQPVAIGGLIGGLAYLAFRGIQKITGTGPAAITDDVEWEPVAAAAPQLAHGSSREVAMPHRPPVPPIPPHAHRHPPQPRPAPPPIPRTYTPATARQIPGSQRSTDITTSLALALFATGLVAVAVHLATDMLPTFASVALFATVTLTASCGLIVPAKLWEGQPGDAIIRRLFQGCIGLGVGAIAWSLQQYLFLGHEIAAFNTGGSPEMRIGQILLSDSLGHPTMAAYMCFFCGLFLVRRWWWQIDSFRKSRFRISSAIVSLLAGAVLTLLFPVPGALGTTWALAISAVVQLSSGWTPQEERLLRPSPASQPHAAPVVADVRHPMVLHPEGKI
ncbi:MAG: protein kinase [Planctomycetaceae bacterium]|nr:protein kinase [Planctomycetaceae bacterium]